MTLTALILATALCGDSLDKQIASVIPTAQEEVWLTIPWRTDLNRARKESQDTGKPMFLWIMNGHPFGCT